MKPISTITVSGEKWKIDLVPAHGQTLHAYKTIQLDSRESKTAPREFMDTCIHELLHVLFPDATEKHISVAAKTISRFLWRLGYRCK